MTRMECTNVVGKENSPMTSCMGSLSQLSENELRTLAKEATREIDRRKNRQRREDINNTIAALQKLSEHYHSLDIKTFIKSEGKNGVLNIALLEIEYALQGLLF